MEEARIKRDANPNDSANLLSRLFFLWAVKAFKRGMMKTPMTSEELCHPKLTDTSQVLGDELEENWMMEVKRARMEDREPKLLHAVIKTFWKEYGLKQGLMHGLHELVFRIVQPILFGILLSYFRPDHGGMSLNYMLIITGCTMLLIFVSNICFSQNFFSSFHTGLRAHVACSSLIYRKALRLSCTALGDTAPGQAVNLLSNDMRRLKFVFLFVHSMWSAPISAAIIMYLVWNQTGIGGLVGVLSVFTFIPLQAYFGKLSSRFSLQTAKATDERIRLTGEIISGIHVIKMYAWEKHLTKLISEARIKELKAFWNPFFVRAIYMTLNLFNSRFAMFVTMLTLSLLGEPLSPEKVFSNAIYFAIVSRALAGYFVRACSSIPESLVCLQRLTKFLTLDEFKDATKVQGDVQKIIGDLGGVNLNSVTARWTPDAVEPTLSNVTVRVNPGSLTAVVGPVGCGKSSFLEGLLGELPIMAGDIKVAGKVSYASQESWLFPASVRQNITFGQPYDPVRYAEVVRVCALSSDFKQWPQGDRTVVGERGISLSGGQRARVNLARAVYVDADIYLLDDPLSAVDTHVGEHLFNECINTFLAGKTRILVTHQLQYLESVDHVVLLVNGRVEVQGTYRELLNCNSEFTNFLATEKENSESESDDEIESASEENMGLALSPFSRNSSRLSRRSKRREPDIVAVPQNEEVMKTSGSALVQYFRSGANLLVLFILLLFFLVAQAVASLCDKWISVWTTQDALLREGRELNPDGNDTSNFGLGMNATIDYWGFITLPWSNSTFLAPNMCLYVNSALVVALFVIAFSRSLFFFLVCLRCSLKLHNKMFKAVSESVLRFFHINPSGVILNRFSKDLGSVDELLSVVLFDAGQVIIGVLAGAIVTISINYMLIIPVAVITPLCLVVCFFFLRTSRNINRVEGATKSPVFTHLNVSLQGLTTIRAYNAQQILTEEFDRHQDLNTSACYLSIATNIAFGFYLDSLWFVLITFVTFLLLLLDTGLSGGEVGLAITQTMAFGFAMQWGMKQSSEVANNLTAAERVLEYTDLEKEPNLECGPLEKENPKMFEDWPTAGHVEFKNLSLRYNNKDSPAIKNLSVVINAGKKVGIVGRTGAGKSSLIGAIFRLAPIEGSVIIDGVDTASIALRRLRAKISIIPQEPVLFSGTIRSNLDPFKTYKDADLWQALEDVELKDAMVNGLDTPVHAGGANFSVGQKQLLCLARALLRNNKILVMDEATASVDPQTDSLIQNTIRHKFQDCTVFTVAHRLNTIMDSDKILVMHFGKMVEFDTPYNLLDKGNGFFSQMINQTGPAMAEQLKRIAKETSRQKL